MSYKYAVVGAGRQGIAAAYDLVMFGDASRVVFIDLDAEAATRRARQIRHWSRDRRERLVDSMNPQRDDLCTRW